MGNASQLEVCFAIGGKYSPRCSKPVDGEGLGLGGQIDFFGLTQHTRPLERVITFRDDLKTHRCVSIRRGSDNSPRSIFMRPLAWKLQEDIQVRMEECALAKNAVGRERSDDANVKP